MIAISGFLPAFEKEAGALVGLLAVLRLFAAAGRGSIGIPADALPPILQMLIAKEFKFVLLRGSKFRYRRACLTGLRLEGRLTEDDMPAEDAET